MRICQLIYLGLVVMTLTYELFMHGKPNDGKHNFIASAIVTALLVWLLYGAGAFNGLF